MNKQTFLQQLRTALHGLSVDEIEEILADYRAHFDESAANGRDEEATATALGDPSWLGQQHIADLREDDAGLLGAAKRLWTAATQRRHGKDDAAERELAWTPGSRMAIGLPAEVTWRPAEKARAILSGPTWLIEHVRLEGDQLKGRFKWRFFHGNTIRLDLEGPPIENWSLIGSGDLHLYDLSQPALALALDGSGDIKAEGRVRQVTLTITGSGDIDLSLLEHAHAIARITGTGDATLAPSEEADLTVEGSGDIKLLSAPPRLKTNISGNGDIRTASGASLAR